MWVLSLDWKDPVEKGIAPTPIFLPEESPGQRSLMGYSPQGLTELDMTEVTQHAPSHPCAKLTWEMYYIEVVNCVHDSLN